MATNPLDTITASAIREMMSAASSGRLDDAVRTADAALANGGDTVALNALVGTLQCQSGNLAEGARRLRIANAARPDDPVIALNLATALLNQGEAEDALAVVPESLANADASLRLLRLRAFLAQQVGDYPASIAAYERLVEINPGDVEALNNLGNSRRSSGDFDGALDMLRRAAELDPNAPPIRFNLAGALLSAGQHKEAEAAFKSMADDFADDWRPHRELHLIYRMLGQEEAALEAIEEAVRRSPDDIQLLLPLASQRLMVLDVEGAQAAYREVIKRDPANAPANVGLAVVLDVSNRDSEFPALIDEATARSVDDSVLNFIRAYDHRRAKRYREGVEALEQVPDELEGARRAHLYGQLCEGAGEYEKAWAAFERMNEIQRELPSQPELRGESYRDLVRARTEALTPDAAARWTDVAPADGRRAPAFLVGFPRSGTTLIDTFLMGHPDVTVLEEEPSLVGAGRIFPNFDDIVEAGVDDVQRARDSYYEFVDSRDGGASPGKLVVDKNPLATNTLPLIRRLFPDARIIVALRHPCDVVLSCFATNFKLNDGMANFVRLDTTAELYDLTFAHLEKVRELLPMPMHMIKYEALVADPEAELRALVEFVGLDWHDGLVDHQKTARERGRIKTASYAQVVEPIYSRSTGRWENFREQMAPVLPVLQPWIDKFGYA
ncbi:sulfotransferase [Sphingomonas sabuli]|uniref:Sulfotransferase n=1 Tax=Sphingomonas sabuli TaxID=2764186 RepID=A0A7G9L172_9SPHN|nr:tetratricopeptide repeat-containing sulfotransferase family protein [Sphingomonas sabuli]QNM82371.1 sulfotransferase [Sphingomonas sabuli]